MQDRPDPVDLDSLSLDRSDVGEVWDRVVSQARIRGVSPETLVNLWLLERTRA